MTWSRNWSAGGDDDDNEVDVVLYVFCLRFPFFTLTVLLFCFLSSWDEQTKKVMGLPVSSEFLIDSELLFFCRD
jgi:hypothetical protein